jgi:hypothetical protein
MSLNIDKVKLVWSENKRPKEGCRYDHCEAITPFGKFVITWKSWKEFDTPTIDECPWSLSDISIDYKQFRSVESAKEYAEKEYIKRLKIAIGYSEDI